MKKLYQQFPFNFKGAKRLYILDLIERLDHVLRTGWVDRGVKDPESVGEHSEELVLLARSFFPEIKDLDKMLKIHAWPESQKELGDIRTDTFCPIERRWTKEEKYIAEFNAMKEICLPLGKQGREILKLWLEFEENETIRAQIAKQLDKFQAIKKAIQYERQGQPVIAQEFIDYDGAKIQKPELIKALGKTKAWILPKE